ncbi:MAG: aminotransferase class V-fold PLP-dependent enzyme, partial [bacterium]|nr:aminotransferase class V-fold PLP-dependent enzyme [bacterium]
CRKGVEIRPSLFGGGQEGGVRSGTENVPAIVGFARAAELIADPKVSIQTIPMRHMRDRILKEVPCRIPGAHVTGSMSHRLPNSASFWFEGVNGKTLAIALDLRGFCVSAGSACSERSSNPSHVLLALGLKPEEALGSLRVSLGRQTRKLEIEKFLSELQRTVEQLRKKRV